jgi:hypothetical protein
MGAKEYCIRRGRDLAPLEALPDSLLVLTSKLTVGAEQAPKNSMVGQKIRGQASPRVGQEPSQVIPRRQQRFFEGGFVTIVGGLKFILDSVQILAPADTMSRPGSEILRNQVSFHQFFLEHLHHDVKDTAGQRDRTIVWFIVIRNVGQAHVIEGDSNFLTFRQLANAV